MSHAAFFLVLMVTLTPSLLAVKDAPKFNLPKKFRWMGSQKATTPRYAVSRTKDTIMYEGLGNFSLREPWNRRLVPEPGTPDRINTKFYLYTRKSTELTVIKTQPKVDLQGTDLQLDRKTFILTHGFLNDATLPWMGEMKDSILLKLDSNVILTDWGDGAKNGNYFQVVANTRIVGAEMARLLKHLEELGLSLSNVHLIGHSLGAQVSSYAAKARPGIGRITALDPAQPCFENYDYRVRIDASDAEFVDVIHTNAKPTIPSLGFGMIRPVGHVDFYMNGGADQPGCDKPKVDEIDSIEDLLKAPIAALADYVACSHGRACEYMIEAITNDCQMWGHPMSLVKDFANLTTGDMYDIPNTHAEGCKPGACIPLGLDTPKYPARGTFSVQTGASAPYCTLNCDQSIPHAILKVNERSDGGKDSQVLRPVGMQGAFKAPVKSFNLGSLSPGITMQNKGCNMG